MGDSCQKLAHVSRGERLTSDSLTPLDYVATTQGNGSCLSTADTFLGYDVAVPVWSTDHTTVAPETHIVCAMFSFPDHLQPDVGALFVTRAT